MSLFLKHRAANLVFLLTLIFSANGTASVREYCPQNSPFGQILETVGTVWFVTSETLKGAAKDIYQAWEEERLMRDVAANRLEQLQDEGKSLKEIFDTLEAEGLGEYVVMGAGRVPPMTGRALMKLLEKNGFRLLRTSGSHQILGRGAETVVVPLHGSKDLGTGLLVKIIKQAGLEGLFR